RAVPAAARLTRGVEAPLALPAAAAERDAGKQHRCRSPGYVRLAPAVFRTLSAVVRPAMFGRSAALRRRAPHDGLEALSRRGASRVEADVARARAAAEVGAGPD